MASEKWGNIDGRPTERTVSSETFVMPGTKGGVSMKLNKIRDVEYVLPKETANRPDYKVKEIAMSRYDKKAFDAGFDKIDWSK